MRIKKYRTLTENEIRYVTDIVIMWKVTLNSLRSKNRAGAGEEWLQGKVAASRQLYKWTSIQLEIDPKQFRAIWLSVAN